MTNKFSKVMLAALLAVGLIGQASAIVIPTSYFVEGESYTDESGNLWEYVGFFDLADGPSFSSLPTIYTGQTAAVEALGLSGASDDYAISAFNFDTTTQGVLTETEYETQEAFAAMFGVSFFEVNFTSWYDIFSGSIEIKDQDYLLDANGDGIYDASQDASAYVNDRATEDTYINYVFKQATEVSAPSTLAIFSIAIFGLLARRFKN
ncbi:hypothetical protein [Paraglaciecola sp. 2405UD69-4]|uniref:hypothetical protein n=1 Tax=Paraglaciecola sp. 2405UD69-4 TaxID=3391836 RepID=UPI0039C9DF63